MSIATWIWARRRLWLPGVLLAIVLAVTFWLVPAADAPFVYEFF